jgi:hypothetical protein
MADGDFFHVKHSEENKTEAFINLAAITKVNWDGTTANVFTNDGETTCVYGEAATRLIQEVMSRCINSSTAQ